MTAADKPIVWLHGGIRTPPFSQAARIEAGFLLRRLQRGETLTMPHSRPLPAVGPRCHELRIRVAGGDWRIVYRADSDAIVIAEIFEKKSRTTPARVITASRKRFRSYDDA